MLLRRDSTVLLNLKVGSGDDCWLERPKDAIILENIQVVDDKLLNIVGRLTIGHWQRA